MDTRIHRRTERRYTAELAKTGTLALDSQTALMGLGFDPEGFERIQTYQVKAWPRKQVEFV